MPRREPCPGWHNDAWRAAETAGEPHDLKPVYGEVRWCAGCIRRTQSQLLELPRLYAQLHIELTEATRPQNLLTGGRGSGTAEPALHPGEQYLRLADDIHDRVTDWAQMIRLQQYLAEPSVRTRPGFQVSRDTRVLGAFLGTILDEHKDPAAGRALVDDIHQVYTRAKKATGDAPVRPISRDNVQCPKCRLAALETEVVDGKYTGYTVCRACGLLSTEAEMAEWISQAHTHNAPQSLQETPQ